MTVNEFFPSVTMVDSKRVQDIHEVHKIQGQNGNWNHDQYMLGLYNGLEMAVALLEGREPDFRTLPKRRRKKSKHDLGRTALLADGETRGFVATGGRTGRCKS